MAKYQDSNETGRDSSQAGLSLEEKVASMMAFKLAAVSFHLSVPLCIKNGR